MTSLSSRFTFASAPDSWGVLDYPGPSWEQSYQKMLDEMVLAGYTGTELGPYGFFPTDPAVLSPELSKRNLKLLGSFVPAILSDPASTKVVVEHIRKVGGLMITIWHNSILGQDPEFSGWRAVYETFLKEEVFWDG